MYIMVLIFYIIFSYFYFSTLLFSQRSLLYIYHIWTRNNLRSKGSRTIQTLFLRVDLQSSRCIWDYSPSVATDVRSIGEESLSVAER